MRKIFQLPQDVVSKIAAGEVIERPAYAVKELIENSIDARATVIEVHIEDAGLKKISVIDNGEGMSREDLELCFLPHTTSKLKKAEELLGVKTLGFRGEALSSIAAISHMTIKSRTPKQVGGTSIEIDLGKVTSVRTVGMSQGTVIIIENLFQSVPARKKFLKSNNTEFRHITGVVLQAALSFPQIHFVLSHNKKVIFDLPKKDSFERTKALFGESLISQVVPIHHDDGYIKIEGLLGKPQIAAKNNQRQYLFVNNRFIIDRLIVQAVREAYGTLLPTSSTPVFRLNIQLPYESVDVNIHPRKTMITYLNGETVFDVIKKSIAQTLSQYDLTFNVAGFRTEHSAKKSETFSYAANVLREAVLPWNKSSLGVIENNGSFVQIHKTYIGVPSKEGYVIVDQHAAHERILYEEFLASLQAQKKKGRSVFTNMITINLSINEAQLMEEYMDIFKKIGFEIETFHTNTIVIRKIPVFLKGRKVEKVIRDMLDDLSEDIGIKGVDIKTHRMITFLACRAAVKAGDSLSQQEIKKLLSTLEKTSNNTSCPHGRPVKIAISLTQLDKLFKRR